MPRTYLALRPDFVDARRRHAALEPTLPFEAWMKEAPNTGIGKDSTARLRDGGAVPPKYIESFVRFAFLDQKPPSTAVYNALTEYCLPLGIPVTPSNVNSIVRAISVAAEPVHNDPTLSAQEFVESLCKTAASLGIQRLRDCVRPVLGHTSDQTTSVDQAIEWIFANHGRQQSKTKLPYDGALKMGAKHIGITLLEYQDRAKAWGQRERWTVVYGMQGVKPIGVSIALPISAQCYERVRSGQINSWDITAAELQVPSAHLFVEAITMEPHRGASGGRTPSELMFIAMLAQCARLTRVPGAGETVALNLLSCAFSPITARRLASFECETVGANLPHTSSPVMERIIHTAKRPTDASLCGNWRTMQLYMD